MFFVSVERQTQCSDFRINISFVARAEPCHSLALFISEFNYAFYFLAKLSQLFPLWPKAVVKNWRIASINNVSACVRPSIHRFAVTAVFCGGGGSSALTNWEGIILLKLTFSVRVFLPTIESGEHANHNSLENPARGQTSDLLTRTKFPVLNEKIYDCEIAPHLLL